MKSPLRSELRGLPFEAPAAPSWAEGLKGAELGVVRSRLRIRQKNESEKRPGWRPVPCPSRWLQGVSCIGFFPARPDWDEPSALPVFPVSSTKIQIAYPSLEDDKLSFRVAQPEDLRPNRKWGVLEVIPGQKAPIVEPELLFVPCLLADLQGHRIGRGGGFYDAYLKTRPNLFSVGLIHSDYVLRKIPESWLHAGDQKVSALMTDSFYCQFSPDGEAFL